MQNGKDHVLIWRELERTEQQLSRGAGAAAGRLYDSMGRPGAQTFTHYGNQLTAGIARVERVRQALDQSAPMAQRLVVQQLSGIGISAVWDMLIAACKDIALYYGGAVVTGAVVGGVIGAAAFGVGAAPGMVIGTAAGAQVGTWVLALLGLKELAEGLGSMLPAALDHYERGFREAWGAAPGDRRDTWNSTAPASGNAYSGAWHMAQGHVIMVMAILTALAAYLSRGRGNKALLMQEIRESRRLGPKFADWLAENEGKLLGHPQMQARPHTPAGMATGESFPANGLKTSFPRIENKEGVGGIKSPGRAIEFEEFIAPSTGRRIQAAVHGNAIVPIEKVSIYARGGVADVSQELRALQNLKQNSRKLFDADPANIDRLDQLKALQHNYERSAAMARELDNIGLTNTPENNNILIKHLLETGQSINSANRVWVPSLLKGPAGVVQVKSTWKIMDDNRAYLNTLMFVPVK